jgi:hypothetical protein
LRPADAVPILDVINPGLEFVTFPRPFGRRSSRDAIGIRPVHAHVLAAHARRCARRAVFMIGLAYVLIVIVVAVVASIRVFQVFVLGRRVTNIFIIVAGRLLRFQQ